MKTTTRRRVRIHLHDEAPRIGSGWRTVEVITEGYKWITVRCPYQSIRHKFRKDIWASIARSMKELGTS